MYLIFVLHRSRAYFSGNILDSQVIQNKIVGEAGFQNTQFFYFISESFSVFGIVYFVSKFYFAYSLRKSGCDSL